MNKTALLVVALVLGACGQAQMSQADKEAAWIDAGKDAVRAKLKDGASAEFRNVFFSQKGGVPVSCGEVNSKNSFGAFGGFQRYIATNSPATTYIEEQVKGFEDSWKRFCI